LGILSLGFYSLAQTWHPVLIAKDRSLSNKPKSSLQNGVSSARAGRAGWLAMAGFYDFGSQSISTTVLYSKQVAPGRAIIPVFQL